MKKLFIFLLISLPAQLFGQTASLEKEEQEMRRNIVGLDGKLDKQIVDLNGDGKEAERIQGQESIKVFY
jgi:hypothetical protein